MSALVATIGAMAFRQRVEVTPSSALATCSCGWRQLTATRPAAWAVAATHAAAAHADARRANARAALYAAQPNL